MERIIVTKISNGFMVSKFTGDKEVVSCLSEAKLSFDEDDVENYDFAMLEAYLRLFTGMAECLGIELIDEMGDELVITSSSLVKDAN